MSPAAEPVIDPSHAAFIMGAVVVSCASRDAHNVPSVSIALGRRLSADRRRLTLFVCDTRSGALVADAAACGAITAVFCEPTTSRTLQVKGADAVVEAPAQGDAALLANYLQVMIPEYEAVDGSEAHARSVLDCPGGSIVAITFTPCAAFVQTPGPRAGDPLAPGSLPRARQ